MRRPRRGGGSFSGAQPQLTCQTQINKIINVVIRAALLFICGHFSIGNKNKASCSIIGNGNTPASNDRSSFGWRSMAKKIISRTQPGTKKDKRNASPKDFCLFIQMERENKRGVRSSSRAINKMANVTHSPCLSQLFFFHQPNS